MRFIVGTVVGFITGITIGVVKSIYDKFFHKEQTITAQLAPLTEDDNLRGLLTHPNWQVRLDAVQNLDASPNNTIALVAMLDDEDQDVRIAARDKVIDIGKPAVASLIDSLQHSSDVARQHAAEALGEIGDNLAIEHLAQAVHDDNKWVRLAVTQALSKFTNMQFARDTLHHIQTSEADSQVRAVALQAMPVYL